MIIKLKVFIFSLVICGLLTSFMSIDNNYRSLHKEYGSSVTDTLSVNKWIRVDSFDLYIIPPASGVQFYKDGIVFLSSSKSSGKMITNHVSFGQADTKYAIVKGNKLEDLKSFSSSTGFPFPTEAMTFTGDYKTMYFTRYSKQDGTEKIFKATNNGDEDSWTIDENPLDFCTGKNTYTHPALSADGKMMIFASNREGSVGGMDLFVSQLKNGVWSEPVNLGDAVNSTANELYPYLDSENNLFFSSDGVQGFGGYDIYVCKFKSNTWERPINLSAPVNTNMDDVAFTISRKDGKTAFYTVKENSGKRAQQLCMITMDDSRPDTLLTLTQYFTRPDISQMVILVLEPAVQATDKASETASATKSDKDVITYRVQFMTSFNPRTRTQISVNGKDYTVYEFLFSGAYRLCVGEFSSLQPAVELETALRKNDFSQATVIAFKNNVLSLDPELLKDKAALEQKMNEQKTVTEAVVVSTTAAGVTATKEQVKPEVNKTATTTAPVKQTTTTAATTVPVAEKKDVVVYRVQIATTSTSKGSYKLNLGGKSYDTFEYQYTGAYRTCVGEYSTLSAATEFQKVCRANGYPQAFVVAFKNNVRSTDPALFK